MTTTYSTANFVFVFNTKEQVFCVYRNNFRVATFDQAENSVNFFGGDTFTVWMLEELKQGMKELHSIIKVEGLVEEYLQDPNCSPVLWAQNLVSDGEMTGAEMNSFVELISSRKKQTA